MFTFSASAKCNVNVNELFVETARLAHIVMNKEKIVQLEYLKSNVNQVLKDRNIGVIGFIYVRTDYY